MNSPRSMRHMPVIRERNSTDIEAPALPEKSPRRSEPASFAALKDPYPGCPPPAYYLNTPPSTAAAELPSKVKRPGWSTRRGGWWRVALIALLVVACILGLTLGLVLGLRRRSSSGSSASSSGNSTYALQFPAGSYAFTTALANISASCTSNANTFRCYPYTTYAASGAGAAATFFWSITQVAPSPAAEYAISAAPNPFVPQFRNISLAVLDRDTDNERLRFAFPMNLAITPAAALDSSNRAATCWFNSTVLSATIWTRQRAGFPVNLTSSVSATSPSSEFDAWPFAVQVEQRAPAGAGVPSCVDSGGESLGNFAVDDDDGSESCSCAYANFGLSS